MPGHYNDRPTNQQLVGMTPEQILGIFGGADKKFEAYLPVYNREREDLARTGAQFSLKNILGASQQAQAKSGFAGGGAIGRVSGQAREGTLAGFQEQLTGFRADYASDVYSTMVDLAGLEAFDKPPVTTGTEAPPGMGDMEARGQSQAAGQAFQDWKLTWDEVSQPPTRFGQYFPTIGDWTWNGTEYTTDGSSQSGSSSITDNAWQDFLDQYGTNP